jgi:hypothetical protein
MLVFAPLELRWRRYIASQITFTVSVAHENRDTIGPFLEKHAPVVPTV